MPMALDVIDSGDHVPSLLCGRLGDASRSWKRVATRAARDGHWQTALADVEMVPVDHTPGEIALSRAWGGPRGDNVWACCIVEGVKKACMARAGSIYSPDARELWYTSMRDLVLSGMDHFWFCLGVLGRDSAYFPMKTPLTEFPDQRAVARVQLEKLLRWWAQICRLDDRMGTMRKPAHKWTWSVVPASLCVELGVPAEQARAITELPPRKAEPHLREIVAGSGG